MLNITSFVVGNTQVVFKVGDLTKERADALVNAANNNGWMGGGVAGALRRAGGQEIEDEAVAKGPVDVGEAWVTGAGSLEAKYVIHAAVMAMDFNTDFDKIYRSTRETFKRADELGLRSLAIPAFGTGVGRFPPGKAAEAMLKALKEHLADSGTSVNRMSFVLYNEDIYNEFVKTSELILVNGR